MCSGVTDGTVITVTVLDAAPSRWQQMEQAAVQQSAPQQMAKLSVTVPDGMGPGQEIYVRAPNGQLFKALIPAGA